MSDVIVVNENDEVIGTMSREEAHRTGVPHRIAVIYVQNQKGEILVHIRMSGRLDHSAGGHLDPGETYEHAAYRELKEELGIEGIKLAEIGHGASVDRKDEKDINAAHVFKVFLCTAEPKKLQDDEVKGVFWKRPEEVWEEMEKDIGDVKYTNGFKKSLRIYLDHVKHNS